MRSGHVAPMFSSSNNQMAEDSRTNFSFHLITPTNFALPPTPSLSAKSVKCERPAPFFSKLTIHTDFASLLGLLHSVGNFIGGKNFIFVDEMIGTLVVKLADMIFKASHMFCYGGVAWHGLAFQ